MLGRTGLKVSQLGFGCMRLPMTGQGDAARVDRELSTPMIHRAIEGGVNYFDTAVGYCNCDSQAAVGEALAGRRDQMVVSTKNPYYGQSEQEWWKNLETSLRLLRTDYIDIYNHHGMGYSGYVNDVAPRVSKWMQKARDQGLIRHICNSFHEEKNQPLQAGGQRLHVLDHAPVQHPRPAAGGGDRLRARARRRRGGDGPGGRRQARGVRQGA